MEYASVGRILHGEHPFQIPTNFVENVGNGILAFGNVQVELIEVFLVLLVKLEQGVGRNAGIDDVFSVVTGVVPTLGAVEGGIGIFNSRGGMVFYGRIRVTCGTGVDACVFFGQLDGGTLEVEELERSLCSFFEGVVGDDDGVTDLFVTEVCLVGTCRLDFREIDERCGGIACGNPCFCLGRRYLEDFFTVGILEGNVLAFCSDNSHLLLSLSEISHLVLVCGGGK